VSRPTRVLCSLVLHRNNKDSEYQVFGRPQPGDKVEPAVVDTRFANSLHFPVGRQLTYRVEGHGISPGSERQLQVEITLLGQFRLVSDSGASAAFEENNGVLACYDRQGPADLFLDIWLLACGLTPLSENARHWRDAPSARLFPLSGWQRTLLNIMHPLGYGLDSHYQRKWTNDNSGWQQIGKHRLKLAGKTLETQTECVMDPGQGCRTISCRFGNYSWRAHLTGLGLAGDHGVPGWRAVTEIDTRSTENPL